MSNPIRTGWTPFKIPPTPTITDDSVYSLTCSNGADGSKNPSQFLGWRKVLPEGQNRGDLLYWDSSSGNNGAWVVLDAPSGTTLHVLGIKSGTLAWTETEDCEQ